MNQLIYGLLVLLLTFTQPIFGGDRVLSAQALEIPEPEIQTITDAPPIQIEELSKLEAVKEMVVEIPAEAQAIYNEASASADRSNLYEPGQCTWFVKSMRPDIPNTWGDATTWFDRASAQGWPTGSEPRIGAVGWRSGHVVFIKAVDPVNRTVTYTDMNGRYIPYELGEKTVSQSTLMYIY